MDLQWINFSIPKSKGKKNGFTLLELMVVLLVIGLVLAFTFPKFQNLLGGDIKSETRKIVGTIQFLYDESAIQKKVFRLNFDLTKQKYWASFLEDTNSFSREEVPFLPERELPKGVKLEDVVVLHEGKVTEGETFTEFYPVGGVERTTIHLQDRRGEQLTLEINPLTGRVRLHEGYRDFFES